MWDIAPFLMRRDLICAKSSSIYYLLSVFFWHFIFIPILKSRFAHIEKKKGRMVLVYIRRGNNFLLRCRSCLKRWILISPGMGYTTCSPAQHGTLIRCFLMPLWVEWKSGMRLGMAR